MKLLLGYLKEVEKQIAITPYNATRCKVFVKSFSISFYELKH